MPAPRSRVTLLGELNYLSLLGWAVASEEYRRDLKKIYAQLEEPRGWGGREGTELREAKWEQALAT